MLTEEHVKLKVDFQVSFGQGQLKNRDFQWRRYIWFENENKMKKLFSLPKQTRKFSGFILKITQNGDLTLSFCRSAADGNVIWKWPVIRWQNCTSCLRRIREKCCFLFNVFALYGMLSVLMVTSFYHLPYLLVFLFCLMKQTSACIKSYTLLSGRHVQRWTCTKWSQG